MMFAKFLIILLCCTTSYCYNEAKPDGLYKTISDFTNYLYTKIRAFYNYNFEHKYDLDFSENSIPNRRSISDRGSALSKGFNPGVEYILNENPILDNSIFNLHAKSVAENKETRQYSSDEQENVPDVKALDSKAQFNTLPLTTNSEQFNSNLQNEKKQSDLIKKYKKWVEVVNNASNVSSVFEFFGENPHFPLFKSTIKEAERHINEDPGVTTEILIKWFKRYPPMTKEGIEAYIDALLRSDVKNAEKYIQQTYVFQNLNPTYATDFRQRYGNYISPVNDAQRAKRLAIQNNTEQLLEMKNAVNEKNIVQYITNAISENTKFNNNMLFDAVERYKYVEQLINQSKDLDAANVLNTTNYGEDNLFLSKKYFEKRRYIAYNILRSGKPELAYNVAIKYPKNIDDDNKARIEWLLGFISYRFFGKLQQATTHFEDAYKYSQKDIRKSKNAFWLAELYRTKSDMVAALEWYRKASEHFSTFYGYLADVRIKQISGTYNTSMDNATVNNIPQELKERFYKRELVQILIASQNIESNKQYRKYFYNKLIEEIEDPYEEVLLVELAKSNNESEILIDKFYDKQHYMIYKSYDELAEEKLAPITNVNSSNCFISTVHSVIKQESNFKRRAKSSAGAMGLMQLMPKTAEAEAKLLGIKYKQSNLYNEYDNLQLGSNLLNRLLEKYDNNFVYAFYAYNAGEGNLAKYKKSIQSLGVLSILETIELIPIKETRLYIKSVLRNMFYYHQRFGCEQQEQLINNVLRYNSRT